MMFRHESVLALVEDLNWDDAWSKRLGSSHLDDTWLYTAATEELAMFITAASSFVRNPATPVTFHVFTFYTSTKKLLRQLRALFVHHSTDSA